MGKRLIIKGADFSENGINDGRWVETWYISELATNTPDTNSVTSSAGFVPVNSNLVQGRTINMIKIKVGSPGIICVAVADKVSGGKATLTQKRTLDFSDAAAGSVITKTFDPMIIGATEYPLIQYTTDTGKFMFAASPQNPIGYYTKVGVATTPTLKSGGTLCVDWGYGEYVTE